MQVNDTLWVDKYRPKRFTQLLGNERVARETMAWVSARESYFWSFLLNNFQVKEWDFCVFGRRKAKGKKRAFDSEGKDGQDPWIKDDEYQRPREKVCANPDVVPPLI